MRARAKRQASATVSMLFKTVRPFIERLITVGAGQHQKYALPFFNPLIEQAQRLCGKAPRILNRCVPARHLSHQLSG